jgi:hypothetical protein
MVLAGFGADTGYVSDHVAADYRILIPAYGGSNPPAPASLKPLSFLDYSDGSDGLRVARFRPFSKLGFGRVV